MMGYARARANEFLVVGRDGTLQNRGVGGSSFVTPGTIHVTVPSVKQEVQFAMTQESKDGIPLRFKGIVVYRIVDPVAAATCFDFTSHAGIEQLEDLISHICLGELRALVSHMTMSACIEERKETLSVAVDEAVVKVASAGSQGDWGISVDIVQIAQVFIVDDDLRGKLQAEVRNAIQATSERSHIEMEERVTSARIESQRRLERAELETARESNSVAEERLTLERSLESTRIKSAAPVDLLRLEKEREQIEIKIDLERRAIELRKLEVAGEMVRTRAEQDLELEILPLRHVPEIATALSTMYQGANLSLYGLDNALISTLAPLVEMLSRGLSGAAGTTGTAGE